MSDKINLDEARKTNNLDQFIKEHPSEGNKSLFEKLFAAMTGKPKNSPPTE
jgi:hypothetical protein